MQAALHIAQRPYFRVGRLQAVVHHDGTARVGTDACRFEVQSRGVRLPSRSEQYGFRFEHLAAAVGAAAGRVVCIAVAGAPGIVATAIYVFINAWNEFLYSLILINSTDKMTVSVALKSLQGAEILNWGDMMAASALVVVPSVIFFMFIQNKIAGGMTEGAVK